MVQIRKILLISLLIFTACAGPYTYDDSGSRIELSENDTFEVTLKGEANTGYSWQLIEPNSLVKLARPPLVKTKGNSVEYTFKFKTVGQGEERIYLEYSNGEEIKKNFELTLLIGTLGPILAH